LKSVVKSGVLIPELVKDDRVRLIMYRVSREEWWQSDLRARTNILDQLLASAQNTLSLMLQNQEISEGYVFAEVATTGLRAFRGEGKLDRSMAYLSLMPQPVKRIIFMKKKEKKLEKVYELVLNGEYWVYDTVVETQDLNYDAVLVETVEDARIVLREELEQPPQRISMSSSIPKSSKKRAKKRKKRRRKQRKKRSLAKSRKTRRKKKVKKKRKRGR